MAARRDVDDADMGPPEQPDGGGKELTIMEHLRELRNRLFISSVAIALGTGFVPVRKPKKLPCSVEFWEYDLEYGTDRLEIHKDAIEPGQNVLIVDDVLATGGTAAASARLVEKLGGHIAGFAVVIELDFLEGRKRLPHYQVTSLIHY